MNFFFVLKLFDEVQRLADFFLTYTVLKKK